MMIILKNQHPTLTERYLFKTYGLYRSISNDQIEKYICIYAGTKTDFPSEIPFDEEQVDPDKFIIFEKMSETIQIHMRADTLLLDAIRARAAELGWK
jgi:hypothetical protein